MNQCLEEGPGHRLSQEVFVVLEATLQIRWDLKGETLQVGKGWTDHIGIGVQDHCFSQLVRFDPLKTWTLNNIKRFNISFWNLKLIERFLFIFCIFFFCSQFMVFREKLVKTRKFKLLFQNIFYTSIKGDGTPTRNGIGAERYSMRCFGKTGMKMCCQCIG